MLQKLWDRFIEWSARRSQSLKSAEHSAEFWKEWYQAEQKERRTLQHALASVVRESVHKGPSPVPLITITEYDQVEYAGAMDYWAVATFPDGTTATGSCRHGPTRDMALANLFAENWEKFCAGGTAPEPYTIITTHSIWNGERGGFDRVTVSS